MTIGCTIRAGGGIMSETLNKEPTLSQPNLTLCMIVRDEQEMLPDFLSSCEGLWDELVVADTGSNDGSVRLLENAGARVIHFPWIDDFSAARNASLEAATGRWILYLDADERPTAQLISEIKSLVGDAKAGAATLIMRNQWPDGTRRESALLRLFRNDPTIRFQYPIHEDASESVRSFLQRNELQLRHLTGSVNHLGYLRETVISKDKKNRDLQLLRVSLKTHPRDFYCWFKIMEIARFWNDSQLWEETAISTAQLLDNASDQEKTDLKQRPFSGEFAAIIARKLPGSDQERLRWLDQSETFAAPTEAWHLRRGLLLENLSRTKEAESAFEKCLTAATAPSSHIRPRLGLCRLALVQDRLEEAADHVQQACRKGPLDTEALLAAVTILPMSDPRNQPGTFISTHLSGFPEAAIDLSRALVGTGQLAAVADILQPLASGDDDAALGYLMCCLVLKRELDLQLKAGQDEADQLFRNWIHLLWKSRRTEVMSAFADGCESVLGVFPWLPEFLTEETRLLK